MWEVYVAHMCMGSRVDVDALSSGCNIAGLKYI